MEKDNLNEDYRADLPDYCIDAFRMLYTYENKLRIFIHTVLKGNIGSSWQSIEFGKEKQTNNQSDDIPIAIKGKSIIGIFNKRKEQREQYGHIGILTDYPLDYLTLDDLVAIFCDQVFLDYFKPYFDASIEKVYLPKMMEVQIIRNDLFHSKKVRKEDAERLKQDVIDILGNIDKYLFNIYRTVQVFHGFPCKPRLDIFNNSIWFPVALKLKKVQLIIIKECEESISRLYLFFPHLLCGDIRENRIINEIKEIINEYAIYFNICNRQDQDEPPADDQDDSEITYSTLLEICFIKRRFKKNESKIASIILNLIDSMETEYELLESAEDYEKVFSHTNYFTESAFFSATMKRRLLAHILKIGKICLRGQHLTTFALFPFSYK